MIDIDDFDPKALGRRTLIRSMALLAGGLAWPLRAAPSLQGGSIADRVRAMKPGDYLWAPEVAPEGPVVIVVSLDAQRAYVYRNGLPIGISTVSTGKAGHETPTGVFTVLQKRVDHKSNLYNNAPMPFMQRLTWDGIAMHAGNLPGYPASHGCIRLPMAFAKLLYGVTRLGLTVIITRDASVPRVAPQTQLLKDGPPISPVTADGELWQPERATSGPLSIVISAADKRMLVLRNGVPIGSTPIRLEGKVAGLTAYMLRAVDAGGYHWMRLMLPGDTGQAAELTEEERRRLSVPDDFRSKLTAILTPGTTVVVTADTLQSGGAGKPMTVIKGGGVG